MFCLLFIVIVVSTPVPKLVNFVENTWDKISIKGCKDLYVSAYCHPHTDDMHTLEHLDSMLKVLILSKNAIICGISRDFNAPIIAYVNLLLLLYLTRQGRSYIL